MKTQIKIVKRKPALTQTDFPAEVATESVEPSTREITIVVKKWIAELKERKSSQNAISPKPDAVESIRHA